MAKAILWIFGLITLGFGVWSFLAPMDAAGLVQYGLGSPAAVTEMRAFYGGLEIGIAIFWVMAAMRPRMINAGLISMICVWGGVALARGAGMLLDGSASTAMAVILAFEALGAVLGLVALKRSSANLL